MKFNNLHIAENVQTMRNQLNGKSGVYCVHNLVNGKKYIGSTVNLGDRLMNHIKGYYSNVALQNSIKYHGLNNFSSLLKS